MPRPSNPTDLKIWLRFPFQDPRWMEKLAVGGLISLSSMVIPGLGLTFLYGYAWQLLNGMLNEEREPSLPEWRDWERILIEGMKLLTIRLTYLLPVFALAAALTVLQLVPMYWAGPDGRPLPVETILWIFGVGLALILLGGFVLGAAASLISIPAACESVAARSFRAGFQLKAWRPVFRANRRGFWWVFAVSLGLQLANTAACLLLSLTIVLIPLVPFLSGAASTYAAVVTWAMAGQAYRVAVDRLESQVERAARLAVA